MDINSKTIDEFRADFNAAIAPLQEKYGVTITLGHITYYEEYFSSRLKVVNGTDPETTAMINFDADVWKFEHLGLQPGMYKRIFKGIDGDMYFIRGFNLRAHKYPIIISRVSDGEESRCSEGFILEMTNEYYLDSEITISYPEDQRCQT